MPAGQEQAVAVVGVGAVLPDAPNAPAFWRNICDKRYSIREVPADRWRAEDYFDADPSAPDKSYSKIGSWVEGFEFDWKRFRIPPRVAANMDAGQQWAVTAAAEALADYGYPDRRLDTERTGVILGTAMGGDFHLAGHLRVSFPEYWRALESAEAFRQLPEPQQAELGRQWREALSRAMPPITEDTMPGELANVVSGRVANVLDLRGPSFIADAACASSFAAITAAMESLLAGRCDAVLTGGVDHNMTASAFVKFCKVGALSATGSRPFAAGADGFVMGEGCAVLLLKRLADAEREGDRVYLVIRSVGASSDGRGKGITAPNPEGQRLAMQRAWDNAGLDPKTVGLVEAHGTSTKVGDVVEAQSLRQVFSDAEPSSVALGSVKGNLGHLKAAAGAAGLLKCAFALREGKLPPTLNADAPNPNIDFAGSPLALNTELRDWTPPADGTPRRAAVSAYGFGGTNFHLVLEEHRPPPLAAARSAAQPATAQAPSVEARGFVAVGAGDVAQLRQQAEAVAERVQRGWRPAPGQPDRIALAAPERLVIAYPDEPQLEVRLAKAVQALGRDERGVWEALRARGVARGSGAAAGKLAFLFPGQGSQYLDMGRALVTAHPEVAEVFEEADRVMGPLLGRPLTDYLFVDADDPQRLEQAELALRDTAITQPAVLTLDIALLRLLSARGFTPDLVLGHSLGEYAALVAAGVLPFAHALEAAAARGREMSQVKTPDPGWMAAVFAPPATVEPLLARAEGYVVLANVNSHQQCVIGGESRAVERAMAACEQEGLRVVRLPVSHAFHTQIVAPAAGPLRQVLDRLDVCGPRLPVVANVDGQPYPHEVEAVKDVLERQIASPVQWVASLETAYRLGARTFVEVGPKTALKGFVDDVLASRSDVLSIFTNHPKTGQLASLDHALASLYAAGHPRETTTMAHPPYEIAQSTHRDSVSSQDGAAPGPVPSAALPSTAEALGRALLEALQSGSLGRAVGSTSDAQPPERTPADGSHGALGSVVITGTGLGLPGADKPVMAPDNIDRILRGEQLIDLVPERFHDRMVDKRVTKLIKHDNGGGSFRAIEDADDVIKLAGRAGSFDLAEEYGIAPERVEALDITTQLAVAAGLDALREAHIPLVRTYRTTTSGKVMPDRLALPEPMRDETGIIFASAFPGLNRFADELHRYYSWQNTRSQLAVLEELRAVTTDGATLEHLQRRSATLRAKLAAEPFEFDRRFLFRVLAMGHSQLAELIGARGPNTHINVACASGTQSVALAEDWIRAGRCRRVVVVTADNVTSEHLLEWIGAGFLATGAVATDGRVRDAVLPFDRRRHGLVMGMGSSAVVVESADAASERGVQGAVELLGSEVCNSAFHGTRLDPTHIAGVMEELIGSAERRYGLLRQAMAAQTLFVSHETYTPARGGSAGAEVAALRHTFGEAAEEVVICNTKGLTGHPMGVGIEDVVAVNALERGVVPPVPNCEQPDPDLGKLNLSRGGRYPVQYAIRLAAGFGSQVAMTLLRRIPGPPDRLVDEARHRRWLADVSGYDRPRTEVVRRVLRIQADRPADRPPVPSSWRRGMAPSARVEVAPTTAAVAQTAQPAAPRASVPADQLLLNERPATIPPWAPDPPTQPLAPASEPGADAPPHPTPAPTSASLRAIAAVGIPPAAATPSVPAPQSTAAAQVEAHVGADDGADDPVATAVLRIVAEQTGYPPDMLELDLDLEADLGIDTVKQAETFTRLRETFDIPKREDLSLRDYPTLQSVVQFVHDNRPAPRATGDAPAAPAAAPADATDDAVAAAVLRVVAEQTGYPPDMLELDLDLEADLGVDTVKQAETFTRLREIFDIPKREDLSLRDYPTLQSVVQFVHDNRPAPRATGDAPAPAEPAAELAGDSAGHAAQPHGETVATAAGATADGIEPLVLRRPTACVVPAAELCQRSGVELDADSRVLVMADQGGVGQALCTELEARGVQPLLVQPDSSWEQTAVELERFAAAGPLQGVYWLAALDTEPELAQLDLARWRRLLELRLKRLYRTVRITDRAPSGPGCFLLAATRLGGQHGYGAAGATAPLGGAVAGFCKAYHHEQPKALVKVVDFEPGQEPASTAAALLAETLRDPHRVEVGYAHGLRHSVGLEERSDDEAPPAGLRLGADTVFLISGAAGSITSAVVADLARASSGTFYLLDRVAEPRRDHPELVELRDDRAGLRARLIEQAQAAGERPTPRQIEERLFALEREEAALSAVQAVERAGGTAHYRQVDLLDEASVKRVVDELRRRHGRVDVLIHAAGLEISRPLADKPAAEFDRVFDVKADGWFNLLRPAQGLPIGAVIAFSSVAGRFGNAGQTDYSAANDLLCKQISSLRRSRPDTRAVAIDWTAWEGSGMATRGSVPKLLEQAGVELLSPARGVPVVRGEIERGDSGGELLAAGDLGRMATGAPATVELDPAEVRSVLGSSAHPFLAVAQVEQARTIGATLELDFTLDPTTQPFLADHQVEHGVPYLPGVVGAEYFAELATLLAPRWMVSQVAELEFQSPLKFHRDKPRTLRLRARAHCAADGEPLMVHAWLESVLALPRPELPPRTQLHFTAELHLSRSKPRPSSPGLPLPELKGEPVGSADIYQTFFHGPAYRVLHSVQLDGHHAVGRMAAGLPPDTEPTTSSSLLDPRLLELCFQTAAQWEMASKGKLCLPHRVGSATVFQRPDPSQSGELFALITAHEDGGTFSAQVVDPAGQIYVEMEGYRTVELPSAPAASAQP